MADAGGGGKPFAGGEEFPSLLVLVEPCLENFPSIALPFTFLFDLIFLIYLFPS